MVDFAAHWSIHAIKINTTFTWKVLSLKVVHLPIACQSHRLSSHMLLAAEEIFGVA